MDQIYQPTPEIMIVSWEYGIPSTRLKQQNKLNIVQQQKQPQQSQQEESKNNQINQMLQNIKN